jgi:hypothetical protein
VTAEARTQPLGAPSGPAVPVATGVRLAVVLIAAVLGLLPWWLAAHAWPGPDLSLALGLVPVVAGLVGWRALRSGRPVPEIHDRQLDLIICVIAVGVAVQLVVLARWSAGGGLYAAAFPCAAAAAIIVAGWGSRALWRLRWAVAMLALAWREPWMDLTDRLFPGASTAAVDFGLLGAAVLALAVTVFVHARRPRHGQSDLVRRLVVAVPGARLATVLVVALGVVFSGLGVWASPSVGLPPLAWAVIGTVEQMIAG